MLIQKNDFVELDFVAKVKEENVVFDVTSVEDAKKHNLFQEGGHYHARVVCVGQHQIVQGVDDALVGKEPGKAYMIEVKAQDAFGMKDPKLLRVVSAQVLKKQNIDPFPGLQLNASGMLATVKSVSGGRVMLDFNHPLAGKDVVYEVKIHKIIEDDKEKVASLLENLLHLHQENATITCEGKQCTITLEQKLPAQLQESFMTKVKELVPDLELRFG